MTLLSSLSFRQQQPLFRTSSIVIRVLSIGLLIALAIRTRELVLRMQAHERERARYDDQQDLAWLPALPVDRHGTNLTNSLRNNDTTQQSQDTQDDKKDGIKQILDMLKELDGMTTSKRAILEAAFSRHRDPDVRLAAQQDYDDTTKTIDWEVEEARCKRYGFSLGPAESRRRRRRRIFWGSLIADDSWHVIGIAAMEYHGIFHSISFVESNTTQTLASRTLRFPPDSARTKLLTSPLLWGVNSTRIHVDYYYEDETKSRHRGSLVRENDQRELILKRWKENGMRKDDIGFLSDVDEVGTRDYLLALQICDIREFTPNRQRADGSWYNDCIRAKLSSSTLWFEATPKCLQVPRRYGRPDWLLGECIQEVGNETEHPSVPRSSRTGANIRVLNWPKLVGNITTSVENGTSNTTTTQWINGPLWDATDFRMIPGRQTPGTTSHGMHHMLPTGYHFHNFFDSLHTLRRKYKTYGHPKQGAFELPLGEIQPNDIGFMVDCLTGRTTSGSKWRQPGQSDWFMIDPIYGIPIAFQKVPHYAQLRHEELQYELAQDELQHPPNLTTTVG